MNLMPLEKFNLLKKRWEEVAPYLDDPTVFDPGLVDALRTMNAVDGLVTIWSCEGHPTETGPKRNTSGYIMFGVRDVDALIVLQRLFRNLSNLYNGQRNLVRLSMADRGDLTADKKPGGGQAWYPVWILNFGVHFTNTRRRHIQLGQAAENAVKGVIWEPVDFANLAQRIKEEDHDSADQ